MTYNRPYDGPERSPGSDILNEWVPMGGRGWCVLPSDPKPTGNAGP
jgi:hypothetical protein